MFEKLKARQFEILTLHHAEAILKHDMPEAVEKIEDVLLNLTIPVEELIRGGGGEGKATQRLRNAFTEGKFPKHIFEVKKVIDGVERECVSHLVDHVRRFASGVLALEIEWNNKDPFFDRDLENFKRLHADAAISIGVIVTRGKSLQDGLREIVEQFAVREKIDSIEALKERKFYNLTPRQEEMVQDCVDRFKSFPKGWAHAFVGDKFGEATTHWRKLEDRVHRGVGNPCPLVLIGIPRNAVIF